MGEEISKEEAKKFINAFNNLKLRPKAGTLQDNQDWLQELTFGHVPNNETKLK